MITNEMGNYSPYNPYDDDDWAPDKSQAIDPCDVAINEGDAHMIGDGRPEDIHHKNVARAQRWYLQALILLRLRARDEQIQDDLDAMLLKFVQMAVIIQRLKQCLNTNKRSIEFIHGTERWARTRLASANKELAVFEAMTIPPESKLKVLRNEIEALKVQAPSCRASVRNVADESKRLRKMIIRIMPCLQSEFGTTDTMKVVPSHAAQKAS
jgi:hypothetical protein